MHDFKKITFLYFLLLLVVGFDPQNHFGVRYLILGIFIVIWIYKLPQLLKVNNIDDIILSMLVYIMPIYGVAIYLIRSDELQEFTDTSYISTAIVASLAYIFRGKTSIKPFDNAIWLIGGIYIIIYLFLSGEVMKWWSGGLVSFFVENNIARITTRIYGNVELPYIYLYSSTLMIIPLVISYTKVDRYRSYTFVYFLGIVISLFLSGTRSHQLISIFYLFLQIKKLSPKTFLYIIILIVIFFGNEILSFLGEIFSLNEVSNEYKLNMLKYYLNIFNDYKTVLFGQGFQAISWDENLKSIVTTDTGATKTELTYIEIIRVFGFPLGLIFICAFVIKLFGNRKLLYTTRNQILLLLLIDSLLNPHLYSTYGAVIFAYAFSYTDSHDDRLIKYKHLKI